MEFDKSCGRNKFVIIQSSPIEATDPDNVDAASFRPLRNCGKIGRKIGRLGIKPDLCRFITDAIDSCASALGAQTTREIRHKTPPTMTMAALPPRQNGLMVGLPKARASSLSPR